MKKLSIVMVMVMAMMMMAAPVYARTYSDVTKDKLDTKSYEAILYVEKYNGWKGLSKNGKLYPDKYMTRKEFVQVLYNLYGKKVKPSDVFDILHDNYIVTAKYITDKCVLLSKELGYKIKWSGDNKTKMRRKDVARYVKIFATYNAKLAPKK